MRARLASTVFGLMYSSAATSRFFIPAGLFGDSRDSPPALVDFAGHVVEAAVLKNSLTGDPFYWALVDTFGGHFDVVIDSALLPDVPLAGGVLSGRFWLSGRIVSPQPERTWLERLIGVTNQ